ncbi:uncharacterized protein MELLADRAFT_64660 [Melampsora larici-populina 98AG31]|uniref:Secreted protein n=1 Tax=Melampsora larici-populina (strain 98AG31 / pathotype 3-4-7) TaxID=747676 RepID=F4RSA6_MELLP|nr:uncharacterized protein MELLADRAFT_64660 [Melampsora larici-populina 98AG31]EGG04724.1 hypothetical protein MELLADRAFT_64660 [Melampsora larici-populina 98AG31]
MRNLRVLAPWGLLIICGLIDQSHSLPVPGLGNDVAESIVRDVKGDETSTPAQEEVWQQVSSRSSRRKQKYVVKNTTLKEIEDNPLEEDEKFPEGAGQNTFPSTDSSSASDKTSKTNPMIHRDLTSAQEELLKNMSGALLRRRRKRARKAALKKIAENTPEEGEKFLEGAEQNTLQKLAPTSNEIMEQESTGLRLRRKNLRRVKKAPVREIEDSPPEEVEEEIADQHPVATAFKRIVIYYLLGYQSMMGNSFGQRVGNDPFARFF